MRFRTAKKLHNGDQVIIKDTQEEAFVISTEVVQNGSFPPMMTLELNTENNEYKVRSHWDVI